MLLNTSTEIAAFQDCPTSPSGFVMDGDEYVAVALPRPWPREVASQEAADPLAATPSIDECFGLAPISEAKKEHLRQLYKPRGAFRLGDKIIPAEPADQPLPDWLTKLLEPEDFASYSRHLDQVWEGLPPKFNGRNSAKAVVIIINAEDITPEPIDWLWTGYIARRKLHLFAGVPETGKTTLALCCAATISSGNYCQTEQEPMQATF